MLTVPTERGRWLTGALDERVRLGPDFYAEMARRHGDVCAFKLAGWKLYLVSAPRLVHSVLKEKASNYCKGSFFDPIRLLLGDGLFFSEGSRWRRQRTLMQPSFHRARLGALEPVLRGCAQASAQRFERAAKTGGQIDLRHEMVRLTLDVAARTLFGAELDGAQRDRIGECVDALSWLIDRRMFSLLQGLPVWVPLPMNLRLKALARELDDVVLPIIEARRRCPRPEPRDLLDALLLERQADGSPALSAQELRDQVMTLLMAGHETTASALTWLWVLLTEHEDVYARVRSEAASSHAGELALGRAVFSEAMRLYPPGWTFARQALADDELGGFALPAGANLVICPYALHRDRRFFEAPERFDPARFPLKGEARLAYLPFGAGARACIGAQLAVLEAMAALSALASRFVFRRVDREPVKVEPLVTLRPGPVRVEVSLA